MLGITRLALAPTQYSVMLWLPTSTERRPIEVDGQRIQLDHCIEELTVLK